MDLKSLYPEVSEIPQAYRIDYIKQTEYLINGEIRHWTGSFQKVLSPIYVKKASGIEQIVLGEYPKLTTEVALQALAAAERAFDSGQGIWPTMSVRQRIKYVENFTFKMQEKKTDVVKLLMWEIGKSYRDSLKEFDRTLQYIKDTIDSLKDLDRKSSRFEIEEGVIGQIRRSPLGVVLCMGPFNYPLNETYATLIPALITGNTVIFKPPKLGVLLHKPLLEVFQKSFPHGVVNTIYGDGEEVVLPLMETGKINVLAFIGTSRVADIIKQSHPYPHRLRSILGLEAKNCAIILPDAPLELTVSEVLTGTLSYNGQRCTALKMLFVHDSIFPEFMNLFNQSLKRLKLAMPWEDGVDITPLPEEGKAEYLSFLVKDAIAKGAKVMNDNGGNFFGSLFYPAVVYPVTKAMQLYHVEQFGPVIPIATFKDINEPLRYVIESKYGQQVSIFGRDSTKIAKLVDPLVNQVARVNINCQCQRGPDKFPFTGRKDSAEGTLSVSDALRVFTIRSLVAAKENSVNKDIITEIITENKSNFISTDFIF
jgi:glyceraldehyde-3-phosphate dehydrogenase (NADP+)